MSIFAAWLVIAAFFFVVFLVGLYLQSQERAKRKAANRETIRIQDTIVAHTPYASREWHDSTLVTAGR